MKNLLELTVGKGRRAGRPSSAGTRKWEKFVDVDEEGNQSWRIDYALLARHLQGKAFALGQTSCPGHAVCRAQGWVSASHCCMICSRQAATGKR